LAQEFVDLGDIMPMGDSITEGAHCDGGYRSPLYTKLTDADYDMQFVGSSNWWSDSVLRDAGQQWHEGHGGYNISQIDGNLDTYIGEGGEDPDIILLMIGTNDMGKGKSTDDVADDLDTLIGRIYDYQPNVKLYVASLTYRTSYDSEVRAYNARIPGIVAEYKFDGKCIEFVDMYDATNPADGNDYLYDSVHPNAAGHARIADIWYDAIHTPEPTSVFLLAVGSVCLLKKQKRKKCV
jgi:hypothetical protein